MTEQLTRLTLPDDPSKQQEIDHYKQFLADLPRYSYLASILAETLEPIEDMIRSDTTFHCTLPALWREKTETQDKIADLKNDLRDLQRDIQRLTRDRDRLNDKLRDTAGDLEHIAARIREVT